MTNKPIKAIIVGAGRRSMAYGEVSLQRPDLLQIVGVADPNPSRVELAKRTFNIPEENCFSSADELASVPKFADAIINGTMDQQHVETSIPLLRLGYDMLLEKPFAVNENEMNELIDVVKENNNKVMVCHVLRYSRFYSKIRKLIDDGKIGKVISISTEENVSYHHMSSSYVRGKWSNSDVSKTTMLLAKCCHDIDVIIWLMNGNKPVSVSSTGSIFQYKPEMAPENSGTHCMRNCPRVDECIYSVKKIYLDNPARWAKYAWNDVGKVDATREEKEESLKGDNRFGKCIYKCDNNVVDHQTVTINFENGAYAVHNMVGGTARQYRDIHIIGTLGEIKGCFEDHYFDVYSIDPVSEGGYKIERFNVSGNDSEDVHGGGDEALVLDFISYISGEEPSVSCTHLEDSVASHLCVFLADKSRQENGLPQKF